MVEIRSPASRAFSNANTFILGLAVFTCFYPLWYTLCVSLSATTTVDACLVTVVPRGFNFLNYSAIISDSLFYGSFLRSIARVAIGTPFTLMVSVMIAYPLSKSSAEFRVRNPLMWLVVFCMVFGGGMIPWYMFMVSYQMTNKLIGLILCGGPPIFYCILIMNAFRSILVICRSQLLE
jgi:putative aldouronate transport system permease protein